MKKNSGQDDLRPEYLRKDLCKGVRGLNYKKSKSSSNLVLLTPEVAIVFPTTESVNDALLSLKKIAEKSTAKKKTTKKKTA